MHRSNGTMDSSTKRFGVECFLVPSHLSGDSYSAWLEFRPSSLSAKESAERTSNAGFISLSPALSNQDKTKKRDYVFRGDLSQKNTSARTRRITSSTLALKKSLLKLSARQSSHKLLQGEIDLQSINSTSAAGNASTIFRKTEPAFAADGNADLVNQSTLTMLTAESSCGPVEDDESTIMSEITTEMREICDLDEWIDEHHCHDDDDDDSGDEIPLILSCQSFSTRRTRNHSRRCGSPLGNKRSKSTEDSWEPLCSFVPWDVDMNRGTFGSSDGEHLALPQVNFGNIILPCISFGSCLKTMTTSLEWKIRIAATRNLGDDMLKTRLLSKADSTSGGWDWEKRIDAQ